MNDNTFWALFWLIVGSCIVVSCYFDYKSEAIRIEADIKIAKIKEDSNYQLRKSFDILNATLTNLK